jgi:dephospho-CoA kinase
MLKVGLTGGVACGKSVVGKMFLALGAKVIRADDISHQLMEPGQPVYEEVIKHFGTGILNPDGSVNRPRLAQAAFGSGNAAKSRVQELNQIVHPAVIKRQEQWMEEQGQSDPEAIAIVEAALILEAGAWERFDRVVVVTCRPSQRIERWAGRLNVDMETAREEVERRMAAQLPEDQKVEAADYVIDNSGSLESTRGRVAELYTKLQKESKALASGGRGLHTEKRSV